MGYPYVPSACIVKYTGMVRAGSYQSGNCRCRKCDIAKIKICADGMSRVGTITIPDMIIRTYFYYTGIISSVNTVSRPSQ